MREGLVTGMFGAYGEGKTYVALSMAVCIAMGKPWMGRETKQRSALYVNTQMQRFDFADRVGEVLRGMGADESCPIKFVTIFGLKLGSKRQAQAEGFQTLQEMVNDTKAEMIFIDAFLDVIGTDALLSSDVQPFFMELREFVAKNKSTVLILHHKNKSGNSYGSVDIENQVDLYVEFNGKTKTRFTIKDTKARFLGSVDITGQKIWSKDGNGRVNFRADDSVGELTGGEQTVYELILHGIGDKKEIENEAVKAMKCKKSSVVNYITGLLDKGVIFNSNEKKGGAGNVAFYEVCQFFSAADILIHYCNHAPEVGE